MIEAGLEAGSHGNPHHDDLQVDDATGGLGILADMEQQILIVLEQERTLPMEQQTRTRITWTRTIYTPMIELMREVNLKLGDVF